MDKDTLEQIDNYLRSAGKIVYECKPVLADLTKRDSLSEVIRTNEDAQRFTDRLKALMLLARHRKAKAIEQYEDRILRIMPLPTNVGR